MNHLATWPNLFIENETYISHRWDFTDIFEKVEHVLLKEKTRHDIAICGQKRFVEYTTGKRAAEHFVKHFHTLIE